MKGNIEMVIEISVYYILEFYCSALIEGCLTWQLTSLMAIRCHRKSL